jgi:hypothetical protein
MTLQEFAVDPARPASVLFVNEPRYSVPIFGSLQQWTRCPPRSEKRENRGYNCGDPNNHCIAREGEYHFTAAKEFERKISKSAFGAGLVLCLW